MTIDQLLDLYLDGIDADGRLSAKTRFDYRKNSESYVGPLLGPMRLRDVTPEVLLGWQRLLARAGGVKAGKPLAPNTIRLARAPLAGAFKLAAASGLIEANPLSSVARPTKKRSIPRHWSPEQARAFLGFMEADRTYPIWAFLLSAGLRIGELVSLRWPNVDLEARLVRVVEFVSTLGYEVVASEGKSRDAIRTIDLDDQLVTILCRQRKHRAGERLAARGAADSDHVFSKPGGGPYHPQRLSRQLASLSVLAGLPRLTAHGLRHTSANRCSRTGCSRRWPLSASAMPTRRSLRISIATSRPPCSAKRPTESARRCSAP